jgi:hypothetical protein
MGVGSGQDEFFCATGNAPLYTSLPSPVNLPVQSHRVIVLEMYLTAPPSPPPQSAGWDPCTGLGAPNYPTMEALAMSV